MGGGSSSTSTNVIPRELSDLYRVSASRLLGLQEDAPLGGASRYYQDYGTTTQGGYGGQNSNVKLPPPGHGEDPENPGGGGGDSGGDQGGDPRGSVVRGYGEPIYGAGDYNPRGTAGGNQAPFSYGFVPQVGSPVMDGGEYGFLAPNARNVAGPSQLEEWGAGMIPGMADNPEYQTTALGIAGAGNEQFASGLGGATDAYSNAMGQHAGNMNAMYGGAANRAMSDFYGAAGGASDMYGGAAGSARANYGAARNDAAGAYGAAQRNAAGMYGSAADRVGGMYGSAGKEVADMYSSGAGSLADLYRNAGNSSVASFESAGGGGNPYVDQAIAASQRQVTGSDMERMMPFIKDAFENTTMKPLQNQFAMMGLGRSGAAGEAQANAFGQMAMPLIQDSLAREERGIDREVGTLLQGGSQDMDTRFRAAQGASDARFRAAQGQQGALYGAAQGIGDARFRAAQGVGDSTYRSAQGINDAMYNSARGMADMNLAAAGGMTNADLAAAGGITDARFGAAAGANDANYRSADAMNETGFRAGQGIYDARAAQAYGMNDSNYRLADMYNNAGEANSARQFQSIQEAMRAGAVGRGIADDYNNAVYEDYLRRQGMAENALYVPFGGATNMIGTRTTSNGK